MSDDAFRWCSTDIESLAPLEGDSTLSDRIAVLKWAEDLIRSAGGDARDMGTIDDILTEMRMVARARAKR